MDPSQPKADGAVILDRVNIVLGGVTILESVSAAAPRGSNTAIVGPNGAGKTTLLLALLGQLPYTGSITVAAGANGRPARIGYVPQRLMFDRGLPVTVMEFLVMGVQRLPLWLGLRPASRGRARELLAAVRAEELEGRPLGALSGGEMQRVLLALALQHDPQLLVLDEPAAGVDFQGEEILCGLLDSLRKERGFTQLMVSHDLAMVTAHATHVICLNRRVFGEGAPREVLTAEVLTATFGLHMGVVDASAMPLGGAPAAAPCCPEDRHA